jgi:dienelactone hydrolase
MMAGFSKWLDWVAIRLAAARMPRPNGCDPHLAQVRQLLDSPAFIPAEAAMAKVRLIGANRLRFDSPLPCAFDENNTVQGRMYRCGQRWQERPAILLLHGWNDVINHYFRFPLMAGQINRSGFNAATLEAPFHFQRRPRRLGAWSNFLCPDLLRTVEAARQAVAETRAFAGWLLQQGCPSVGLMGVSLGGWLGGLAVRHDARFSCAVLMVPATGLERLVEEAAFCRSLRLALKGRRVEAGQLNLTAGRPAMPKENILLIEAVHDLFVPAESTEELWRAWDQPAIWRLRHGHLSVLGAPGLNGRIIRWMAPRLQARAVK